MLTRLTRGGYLLLAVVLIGVLALGAWLAGVIGPGWTIAAGLPALVAGLILALAQMAARHGADQDEELVRCPACGIRIPIGARGRQECYNCGREFGILSGRYPVQSELGGDEHRS